MFNLKNATVLTKAQQKNVLGGRAASSSGGPCCIHYRSGEGSGTSGTYLGKRCGFSVSDAQYYYQHSSVSQGGGSHISGYCCASC